MATITLDAKKSIGLIYDTVYKPKEGIFHNKSFALHNAAVVQHSAYEQNDDLAKEGAMSDATYFITDTPKYNNPVLTYNDATIDNMFFRSLKHNSSLNFIEGLGIGLLPKRDPGGKLVESILEVSIQTEIGITAEAFQPEQHLFCP